MDIEILLKELREVENMITQWRDVGGVTAVEKDIALGKISDLYARIKFSTGFPAVMDFSSALVAATVAPDQEKETEPETAPVREVEKVQDEQSAAADKIFEKNSQDFEGDIRQEAASTSGNGGEERSEESGIPADTVSAGRPRADKAKLRSLYDDDSVCRPVSGVNRPMPAGEGAGTTQAVREPYGGRHTSEGVRHGVQPRSGYDDSRQEPGAEHDPQAASASAEAVSSAEALFGQAEPTAAPTLKPASEPTSEKTEKKVLGEVISAGGGTPINEILGRQNQYMDVAGKIYSKKVVTSIRQSIGINDRFQLIRDLFGGDAELYSETVVVLDGFDSLDDALLYINDNFQWDPDSESVAMLVDLLEHKLGF